MIGFMIDLTLLGQFHIITHPEVDLLLIIRHLIYQTFLVGLLNQLFDYSTQATFLIN